MLTVQCTLKVLQNHKLLDIIFDVTPIAHPHIFFLGQMMANCTNNTNPVYWI